jgi:hypothetical protein
MLAVYILSIPILLFVFDIQYILTRYFLFFTFSALYTFYIYYLYMQSMLMYNVLGALGQLLAYLLLLKF